MHKAHRSPKFSTIQVQCALSAHRPSMCCGLALEDCISYPPPHDQCGLYQYVFLFYPNRQRTRAYIVEGARRYLTQCLLPLPASRHPRKMDMTRNKTKKDENSKYMVYMACSLFPLSAACGPETVMRCVVFYCNPFMSASFGPTHPTSACQC